MEKMLTASDFSNAFNDQFSSYTLNKIIPTDGRYQLFIKSGVGYYELDSGRVSFEIYVKKPLVYFMNKLHYNQKNYWTLVADVFAGVLIFMALSGMFMVRGKNSLLQRGKWFFLKGIALLIAYIWL